MLFSKQIIGYEIRVNPLEHIGVNTVKPVDKVHDIWHSSYKCSYMEANNEIR